MSNLLYFNIILSTLWDLSSIRQGTAWRDFQYKHLEIQPDPENIYSK